MYVLCVSKMFEKYDEISLMEVKDEKMISSFGNVNFVIL